MSSGFGLEDLETCERVFAGSNAVTRLTRDVTSFHRRQYIDMYFKQWDADKYEHLGRFLLNNYKQALEVLKEMLVQIDTLTCGWEITDLQYASWLKEERWYLKSKESEPEADVLGVEYVELLSKYEDARKLWEASKKLTTEALRSKNQAQLRQVTHDTWEGVLFLQKELQIVEERLDVGERWTTESTEFKQASEYLQIQTYQRAVDKLEGLVVHRLFKLTKANVSQTGYKQRMHILKALKARSKAIQRALTVYNQAAAALEPPRPKLTWAQIVEYTTLAEFEILRSAACEDIRNLEWADAKNRQATICHLKMQRAREEIMHLNIEIKRLATWLVDECKLFQAATGDDHPNDPLITAALQDLAAERIRVNTNLAATLHQIYTLPGYTGEDSVGAREDHERDIDSDSSSDEDGAHDLVDKIYDGMSRLVHE